MLVPYEHLNRITKRCGRPDTITVSKADGDKILFEFPIGNQTGQEHIESLPVEEYPAVPKLKAESVSIKDDIRQAILEAFECASVDETRVILNGAYLDVSGKQGHYIVATDGRHLYSSNSFTLPLEQSLLIPDHKFLGFKEFNNDGEWQLRVQPGVKDNAGLFQISSRRWRFIGRQVEGNYPNWRQVVPDEKQFNTTVELSPSAMEAVLNLVPRIPCHDAINNPIGLVVEKKKLVLRGRGANDSKWTNLDVEGVAVKGPAVTVFLNRQFLTKALKFGMNTVEFIDHMTPLKFSSGGKQIIVMPLRASDPAPAAASASRASTDASPKAPGTTQEASPTERSTTMPRTSTTGNAATNGADTTNGNGNGQSHEEAAAKPAIEVALEKIETIKGSYREAIRGLNDLADTLKQVQREQKGTDREVQSIRVTLEKLQSVRI
jgi:hypothetical protein